MTEEKSKAAGLSQMVSVAATRCCLVRENGEFVCVLERSTNVVIEAPPPTHGADDGEVIVHGDTWAAALLPEVPVLQAAANLFIFTNLASVACSVDGPDAVVQSLCVGVFVDEGNEADVAAFLGVLRVAANLCVLQSTTPEAAVDEEADEAVSDPIPKQTHVSVRHRAIESQRPLVEGPDDEVALAVVDRREWDDVACSKLEATANTMSYVIEKSADHIGSAVKYAGQSLRGWLLPSENDVKLSTATKTVVSGAEKVTSAAVKTTAWLLSSAWWLADTAMRRYIGPWVKRHFPSTGGNVSKKWGKVIKAGGLGALGVLNSLAEASDTLLYAVADETTETVKHRYGDEAAEYTAQGAKVVTNASKLYHIKNQFTYKAVMKKGAKRAAVVLVTLEEEGKEEEEEEDGDDVARKDGEARLKVTSVQEIDALQEKEEGLEKEEQEEEQEEGPHYGVGEQDKHHHRMYPTEKERGSEEDMGVGDSAQFDEKDKSCAPALHHGNLLAEEQNQNADETKAAVVVAGNTTFPLVPTQLASTAHPTSPQHSHSVLFPKPPTQ